MVSVVIGYNKDRGFLKEAVASVEAQTYRDYEIVLAHGPGNWSANANIGLEKSRGEYVKFLAEDDILLPHCLEILAGTINGYDFVHADGENFGDLRGWPERYYDGDVTFESMLRGNGINGGAVLYRTDRLREAGGWDEEMWTAEEYELHLRLLKLGYTHKHISEPVFRYRRHEHNKSGYSSTTRVARGEFIKQIRQKYV